VSKEDFVVEDRGVFDSLLHLLADEDMPFVNTFICQMLRLSENSDFIQYSSCSLITFYTLLLLTLAKDGDAKTGKVCDTLV
jgi:hypothetical protein